MEDTTLEQNMGYSPTGLIIDNESKSYLQETAKWAYFLSILGFIVVGFMVLAGIFSSVFLGAAMSMAASDVGPFAGGLGAMFGIIYLVIAALYFFPVLFMYRFATKMKRGLRENHQSTVTTAFHNLKKLYKFTGIFTIIIFVLYILMFLFMGVFGAMSAF